MTTDVMALARIIYEYVAGVAPLKGAEGPPVPASVHNPAVSEYASAVLARAMTGDIRDTRGLARQLQIKTTPRR